MGVETDFSQMARIPQSDWQYESVNCINRWTHLPTDNKKISDLLDVAPLLPAAYPKILVLLNFVSIYCQITLQ